MPYAVYAKLVVPDLSVGGSTQWFLGPFFSAVSKTHDGSMVAGIFTDS